MGTDDHRRITIETERILLITQGQAARGWCENCGHEVGVRVTSTARTLLAGSGEIAVQERPNFVRAKTRLGNYLKALLRAGARRNR